MGPIVVYAGSVTVVMWPVGQSTTPSGHAVTV